MAAPYLRYQIQQERSLLFYSPSSPSPFRPPRITAINSIVSNNSLSTLPPASISATSHLKDSAQDARSEIYKAINGKRKWAAEEAFDKILHVTESETKAKAVESAKNYILGNWTGIMESVKTKDKSLQCSAEGHVSHIYSDRMSSRPLGWSRTGADKMARLRIYRQNKRDILELVRYQKKELPLAAGTEEVIYSSTQMLSAERRIRNRLGKLADMPVYSIPYPQIKKIAALKNHIWGL